jgi:hypothetical protein
MAKELPHFFHGKGQLNLANLEFTSTGNATYLGKFTEVGTITSMVEIPGQPGEFLISGWAHLTATLGDVLHETFEGQLNLATGVASATITYVPGGSGRFANASGTATLQLQLDLSNGSFRYRGQGVLDF